MTEKDALDWIANLFEEPPGQLRSQTPRSDVVAWDSLGVLTLMASLDSDFGIELSDDEVQEMTTVGDIVEILRRNGKVAPA